MESMKGIVAYDSVNGNTKQVAEAIAQEIRSQGHEAELVFVEEAMSSPVGDFMFIGSPTRASKMTKDTMRFIENLDTGHWKSRPIVAFDTVGPLSKDAEKRRLWLDRVDQGSKNAASRIMEACSKRGLSVRPKLLHLAVTGMWGPLAPDALDMARDYTRGFLNRVR